MPEEKFVKCEKNLVYMIKVSYCIPVADHGEHGYPCKHGGPTVDEADKERIL